MRSSSMRLRKCCEKSETATVRGWTAPVVSATNLSDDHADDRLDIRLRTRNSECSRVLLVVSLRLAI